ncbi:hypothetical protein HRbin08_01522 [bacterium HR08]|nr:hypothetical protein HRbin08_01522 [bacterium HR08]
MQKPQVHLPEVVVLPQEEHAPVGPPHALLQVPSCSLLLLPELLQLGIVQPEPLPLGGVLQAFQGQQGLGLIQKLGTALRYGEDEPAFVGPPPPPAVLDHVHDQPAGLLPQGVLIAVLRRQDHQGQGRDVGDIGRAFGKIAALQRRACPEGLPDHLAHPLPDGLLGLGTGEGRPAVGQDLVEVGSVADPVGRPPRVQVVAGPH